MQRVKRRAISIQGLRRRGTELYEDPQAVNQSRGLSPFPTVTVSVMAATADEGRLRSDRNAASFGWNNGVRNLVKMGNGS